MCDLSFIEAGVLCRLNQEASVIASQTTELLEFILYNFL